MEGPSAKIAVLTLSLMLLIRLETSLTADKSELEGHFFQTH